MSKVALATPSFVVKEAFDGDETFDEKIRKEEQGEGWKQHWRSHPESNSRMAEAYAEKKKFMAR